MSQSILVLFLLITYISALRLYPHQIKTNIYHQIISLQAKNDKIGGIYEFKGNEPPPMFAKLFGIEKNDKPKRKSKPTSSKVKVSSDNKPESLGIKNEQSSNIKGQEKRSKRSIDDSNMSIDELEMQLLSKYGSSAYTSLEDDDEDEDDDVQDDNQSKSMNNLKSSTKTIKSFVLGSNQVKGFDLSSKSFQPTAFNEESPTEDDNDVNDVPKQEKEITNSKFRLFDRIKAKKEKLISSTSMPSSNDDNTKKLSLQIASDDDDDDDFDDEVSRLSRQQVIESRTRAAAKPTNTQKIWINTKITEERSDTSKASIISEIKPSPEVNYRFRKPPMKEPLNNQDIELLNAKKEKVKAEELERDVKQKERLKKKKEEAKNTFNVFEFNERESTRKNRKEVTSDVKQEEDDLDDSKEEEKTKGQTMFSDVSFEDIGVTNTQLLSNIEALGIFNPTKIQEKIIPFLREKG